MTATCTSCGRPVTVGVVCCSGLETTWKCGGCHRLTRGFVAPYRTCAQCGGALAELSRGPFDEPLRVRPIREAVQLEVDSYHFYRLAWLEARDPVPRAFFAEMAQLEMDHLHELAARYHVRLDQGLLERSPEADGALAKSLFAGIRLRDPVAGPLGLYDRALEMEHRAMDHFASLAESLAEGPEKDICRELAAEEQEHIRLLTQERARYAG